MSRWNWKCNALYMNKLFSEGKLFLFCYHMGVCTLILNITFTTAFANHYPLTGLLLTICHCESTLLLHCHLCILLLLCTSHICIQKMILNAASTMSTNIVVLVSFWWIEKNIVLHFFFLFIGGKDKWVSCSVDCFLGMSFR